MFIIDFLKVSMRGNEHYIDPLKAEVDSFVTVAEGATISPDARIEGGCYISANAKIIGKTALDKCVCVHSNAQIASTTIGKHSCIGQYTTIENSTIGDNVTVGQDVTIRGNTWINDGATISFRATITSGSDVPAHTTVPENTIFSNESSLEYPNLQTPSIATLNERSK